MQYSLQNPSETDVIKANLSSPEDWIQVVLNYFAEMRRKDGVLKLQAFPKLDKKITLYTAYIMAKKPQETLSAIMHAEAGDEVKVAAPKPNVAREYPTTLIGWGKAIWKELSSKPVLAKQASAFNEWLLTFTEGLSSEKLILATPKLKKAVERATTKFREQDAASKQVVRSLESELSALSAERDKVASSARTLAEEMQASENERLQLQQKNELLLLDRQELEQKYMAQQEMIRKLNSTISGFQYSEQEVTELRGQLQDALKQISVLSTRATAAELASGRHLSEASIATSTLEQTQQALEALQRSYQKVRLANQELKRQLTSSQPTTESQKRNGSLRQMPFGRVEASSSAVRVFSALHSATADGRANPPSPTHSVALSVASQRSQWRQDAIKDPGGYSSTNYSLWKAIDDFRYLSLTIQNPYHLHLILATLIATDNVKLFQLEDAAIPLDHSDYLLNVMNSTTFGKQTGTILRDLSVKIQEGSNEEIDLNRSTVFLMFEDLCDKFWIESINPDEFVSRLHELSTQIAQLARAHNQHDVAAARMIVLLLESISLTPKVVTVSKRQQNAPCIGAPGYAELSGYAEESSLAEGVEIGSEAIKQKLKAMAKIKVLQLGSFQAIKDAKKKISILSLRRKPVASTKTLETVNESAEEKSFMAEDSLKTLLPPLNQAKYEILESLIKTIYDDILQESHVNQYFNADRTVKREATEALAMQVSALALPPTSEMSSGAEVRAPTL